MNNVVSGKIEMCEPGAYFKDMCEKFFGKGQFYQIYHRIIIELDPSESLLSKKFVIFHTVYEIAAICLIHLHLL